MDLQDLKAAFLIRQGDFNLDLQASRAKEGLVDKILPVRHANQQDVVQLIHAVCKSCEQQAQAQKSQRMGVTQLCLSTRAM